ncbi:MAG TPA: superinfection immunity protein [Bacteroidia bacterium]|nr:superinfection immunity protein [Bacteroidia bacterium]
MEILLILVVLLIYFLPTIVVGKKSFAMQVFLLNLLLGWTFLGWVIALVWAAKKEDR